jgi:flagellar hook-basal body complex protein FliE
MVDLTITKAADTSASATTRGPVRADAVEGENGAFGTWLARSLSEVDRMQKQSDAAARKLITGESKDIHGTMIAMQKAGIAMDLVVEIRNKVIAAYEEVKRMQF